MAPLPAQQIACIDWWNSNWMVLARVLPKADLMAEVPFAVVGLGAWCPCAFTNPTCSASSRAIGQGQRMASAPRSHRREGEVR